MTNTKIKQHIDNFVAAGYPLDWAVAMACQPEEANVESDIVFKGGWEDGLIGFSYFDETHQAYDFWGYVLDNFDVAMSRPYAAFYKQWLDSNV